MDIRFETGEWGEFFHKETRDLAGCFSYSDLRKNFDRPVEDDQQGYRRWNLLVKFNAGQDEEESYKVQLIHRLGEDCDNAVCLKFDCYTTEAVMGRIADFFAGRLSSARYR